MTRTMTDEQFGIMIVATLQDAADRLENAGQRAFPQREAIEETRKRFNLEPGYRIVDARYAKGEKVVMCESSHTKLKTRAMRLCEALGGRWVHRSNGYHLSKRKASRFEDLYAAGWDGSTILNKLIEPGGQAAGYDKHLVNDLKGFKP